MNVMVRMYNTGFGDCFLLTIPAPDRPRKILIDCGKHMLSKTAPKLSAIVDQLLADIEEDGERRVDVVIATHRHQDHVSGFADPRWADVQVSEVWMPWTEDPDDSIARDICDRQSSRAALAQRGLTALGLAADEKEYLLGYAGNNLKNATAMNLLHGGFQGSPRRRFLPLVDPMERTVRTDALPGVDVHVLGPPRDPEVMREMDPPESESFLRAWFATPPGDGTTLTSFGEEFMLEREEYERLVERSLDKDFPKEDQDRLAAVMDEPSMELLAKLEEAVNATSLVLLFHVGSTWMLFSADAQWGTWNAILNDPVHAKLLENLTFYKVGHHGSHNATPISFVERFIKPDALVMLPYGKVERWPSIPRDGLMKRLAAKGAKLARSDQAPPNDFTARMAGIDVLSIDVEMPV